MRVKDLINPHLSPEETIDKIHDASDSHFIGSIGDCYTKLDIDSIDDIYDVFKKNKTKAFGRRTSNYLIAKEVFNKKIRGLIKN